MNLKCLGAAVAACLMVSSVAMADDPFVVDSSVDAFISETSSGASFTASFSYSATDDNNGSLTVVLTNTTSQWTDGEETNFGNLTAIAFSDAGAAVTLDTDGASGFVQLTGGISTPPPGGSFGGVGDFGVALAWDATDSGDPEDNANEWQGAGGGGAGGGLNGGAIATLVFSVFLSGGGAESLTAADFAALNESHGVGLVARFKGVGEGGESDTLILVPLPPAVWLAGAGLIGVGVLRRRFA